MELKKEILNELIDIRRYLHMHPEIGFSTENTISFIKRKITDLNFDKTKINLKIHEINHSLIVIFSTCNNGKIIGLRSDIDGLSLKEENNTPYKSTNDYMHACGHDAHTAILLTVLLYLLKNPHLINGTIKFIFQAAEEGPNEGGAYYLANHYLLSDVDEFYALHVNSEIDSGIIAIRKGPIMAESNAFKIEIFGKSTHIGLYHQSIDALKIGIKIIQEIESIKTSIIAPSIPCIISIGSFQSGSLPNIISNYTKIEGTVRTFNQNVKQIIIEKIKQITKSKCDLYNANYQINFNTGYPPIINSNKSFEFILNVAKDINVPVKILDEPFFFSDDFSRYLINEKGAYYFLGTKKDLPIPLHSSFFDINEDAMYIGFLMHLQTIIKFFNN